ncbi:MAG: DNA polymerase I [Deltaproteobacteria bacterium]|nr:DNA polymerase I [Deltaproteobacteria bacterium]MBW2393407.1 DNA polymerase I [Deltaproteobacteria bacterium]
MPRLVVIDGANFLYRAFFGVPPLRNADGFPTNAVYGFANMLRKVLREEAPDGIVIAMDPPGGSFRKELYSEYKANRDAQPEDLSVQIPVARELIEAFSIPIFEVPGFEADDVIASLVEHSPADLEVVIVSTDKDLMQLVSDRVVLLDTMKDKRIGPAEVEARFGVPPAQLLDVRALVGDPSDNIPGVKGIGEKGAAKLIGEWGDLETLIANAAKVKGKKAREGLEGQADEARLSKQLATLRTDVPLPLRPADLSVSEPNSEVLREMYKRLEFTRLLDDLDGGTPTEAAPEIHTDLLTTKRELSAWLKGGAKHGLCLVLVGGDPESGLVGEPAGLAIACEDRIAYLPPGHRILLPICELNWDEALSTVAAVITSGKGGAWRGRDTKRIQTVFAEAGCPLPPPDFDVELAGFLLDPAAHRTTAGLAQIALGRSVRSFEEIAGRGAKAIPPYELAVDVAGPWAGEEVAALRDLESPLRERLAKDELDGLFEDVELPLTAVLSEMERAGVRIDEAKLAELSEEYESELSRIQGRIYELAGEEFTIASPKQLQVILFDKLKLPPIKKTKTGFSTDEGVLEQLASQHDLPAEILAYRRLAKLKSTYVDALPPLVNEATGRIHPTFNQSGAATGRLSSTHPNVQNIPIRTEQGIRIREAFIPADGNLLVSADYSQVELRVMAHFSRDASLIDAFHSGEDIHRRTAAEVGGIDPADVTPEQRDAAKAINFGILYGSSAFGIANQLGIAQAEAQQTIDRYFAQYEGVRTFLEETKAAAKRDGFVRTLLGRRRYLPDLGSRNRALRMASERMAVNTVIQGTAADLIKKAMIEVSEFLRSEGMAARMILQVHDELVFDAPAAEVDALGEGVRTLMEGAYALDVPLVVDVGSGEHWRAAH